MIPPSPRMFWTFLNLGKIGNLMTPPQTYFGKKLKLRKFWILGTPPQKKIISLKHLKFTKNHFKTNLFFVQLKHLKSTFLFGTNMKIHTSNPLHILNCGLFDFRRWSPPFGLFPLIGAFFISQRGCRECGNEGGEQVPKAGIKKTRESVYCLNLIKSFQIVGGRPEVVTRSTLYHYRSDSTCKTINPFPCWEGEEQKYLDAFTSYRLNLQRTSLQQYWFSGTSV